jgi:hypothetical protein
VKNRFQSLPFSKFNLYRYKADFELLDEDGGKGWELVCGLLSQRKQRTSVSAAVGHPFLR